MRILADFGDLLDVSCDPQKVDHDVEEVASEVDEVPHVPQIGADALDVDLLGLLPYEA